MVIAEAAQKKWEGTLAQVLEEGEVAEVARRLAYAIRRKDHGTQKKWKQAVSELTTVIQRVQPHLPAEDDEAFNQYELQQPSVQPQFSSKMLYMSPGEAPVRPFLGFAYFNRAIGYLVLKEFILAIKDARMAMRLNPYESRSLEILAKACRALGWYQLAETSYRYYLHDETAESLSAERREALLHCWEEAEDADRQTREGHYDLDSFLRKLKLTSEVSTAPAKCCDFVGPVVIARSTTIPKTGFGTGRGMFATRDIDEGDLLCVCNPLALDVQVPPWSKDITVSCLSKQLKKVFQFESSPAARYRIMSMMTGAEHTHVPPKLDVPEMEIFHPSNTMISYKMVCNFFRWEDDLEMSYLPRFSEPEALACNHSDVESQYGELLRRVGEERIFQRVVVVNGQRRTVSGLWILPAFRNHSCIPNSYETYIGDTMFVRACKPIAEGEEITSAYNRVYIPLEARRLELGRKWDGGCQCQRCTWEEALLRNIPELASLSRVCYDLYNKSLTPGRGQAMTDQEYIKIGVELENILQNLGADAERKNWVRASFFAIYHRLCGLYVKAGASERVKLARFKDTAIHALESVQPAHELILRMLLASRYWTGHPCTVEEAEVDEWVFRTVHCMFGRKISLGAIKRFITKLLAIATENTMARLIQHPKKPFP